MKRRVLIKIRKLLIEEKLSVHYCGNLPTFDGLFLVFSMTPTIKKHACSSISGIWINFLWNYLFTFVMLILSPLKIRIFGVFNLTTVRSITEDSFLNLNHRLPNCHFNSPSLWALTKLSTSNFEHRNCSRKLIRICTGNKIELLISCWEAFSSI